MTHTIELGPEYTGGHLGDFSVNGFQLCLHFETPEAAAAALKSIKPHQFDPRDNGPHIDPPIPLPKSAPTDPIAKSHSMTAEEGKAALAHLAATVAQTSGKLDSPAG